AFAFEGTMPAANSSGGVAAACRTFAARTTGMIAMREWIDPQVVLANFDMVLGMQNNSCSLSAPAQYAVAGCNGLGNWDITEQGISAPNTDHVSTTPCPAVGTWTCVELDYALDPPARARLYVGDAL